MIKQKTVLIFSVAIVVILIYLLQHAHGPYCRYRGEKCRLHRIQKCLANFEKFFARHIRWIGKQRYLHKYIYIESIGEKFNSQYIRFHDDDSQKIAEKRIWMHQVPHMVNFSQLIACNYRPDGLMQRTLHDCS